MSSIRSFLNSQHNTNWNMGKLSGGSLLYIEIMQHYVFIFLCFLFYQKRSYLSTVCTSVSNATHSIFEYFTKRFVSMETFLKSRKNLF